MGKPSAVNSKQDSEGHTLLHIFVSYRRADNTFNHMLDIADRTLDMLNTSEDMLALTDYRIDKFTDIVSIARACEDAGADGISLINTLLGMRIDLRTRKPIIANKMGGFSGPAIFPVALRMVYQVSGAVKIPVVGMGGVSSAEDVVEMMLAGATAVEVGAANLVNPYACRDIIRELPAVMEKYKVENLKDIIGGAK